jgi:hypothetical protein
MITVRRMQFFVMVSHVARSHAFIATASFQVVICEPTGRANPRPMTGSAKQSMSFIRKKWIASSLCSSQ